MIVCQSLLAVIRIHCTDNRWLRNIWYIHVYVAVDFMFINGVDPMFLVFVFHSDCILEFAGYIEHNFSHFLPLSCAQKTENLSVPMWSLQNFYAGTTWAIMRGVSSFLVDVGLGAVPMFS